MRPPILPKLSDAELRAEVLRRAHERERKAEAVRRQEGRKVLGMKGVREQHWAAIPQSRDDMFRPVPRAAGNKWAVEEAARRCEEFVADYREARGRWIAGEREVVFPRGTFLMRELFGGLLRRPSLA